MGLGAMTLSLLGRDWRRPDPGAAASVPDVRSAAPPPAPPPAPPIASIAPIPPPAPEPSADPAENLQIAEDLAASQDAPEDDIKGA